MDPSHPQIPSRADLLSTYWRDPEYLAYVPLTSSTVLDYFARSIFFDPESTNEVLRMQNIGNPQGQVPGMGKTAKQQEEELRRFKGIEFVVVHAHAKEARPGAGAEDTLYVIQKRRRDSPTKTQVLETYYVLNGNVHMAPDLETVLSNRMTTALHSLRDSLSLARRAQARPITLSQKTTQTRATGKTLGASAAEETAEAAQQAPGGGDDSEEARREDTGRERKVPSTSSLLQARPIYSVAEASNDPLRPVFQSLGSFIGQVRHSILEGSFISDLQHFTLETPVGTAIAGAAATAGSWLIYWRYLRRIRSAEYITPRELRWRRSLTGTVTHVGDADGFRLYHQPGPPLLRSLLYPVPKTPKALKDQTLSIRLAGADAPEAGHFGKTAQPFSTEAREELVRLVSKRTVRCEVAHVDQYKRLVATPYVWLPPYVFGSTNVSLSLVKKGLATVYRQGGAEYGSATFLWRVLFRASSGLGRLERAEASAKRRKLGLWSQGSKLETPADYKRRLKA
ncbi:unnamed protein product [Parajaminaea phylloscopi]